MPALAASPGSRTGPAIWRQHAVPQPKALPRINRDAVLAYASGYYRPVRNPGWKQPARPLSPPHTNALGAGSQIWDSFPQVTGSVIRTCGPHQIGTEAGMERTRKSGRLQERAVRRLRLEPLEHRLLLAIAAFNVNLYEDLGGSPGNLIAGDTVQVGDPFFVEITARELDPRCAGLRGVSLDIAWDPHVLTEIDTPFDPSELITRDLPLFNQGTLDTEAGTIDNLSGAAFLSSDVGRAIGNLAPERFALLHFQALQPADASAFSVAQGRSRIVTVPVATLANSQIDFETQTITVVATGATVEVEAGMGATQVAVEPSIPSSTNTVAIGNDALDKARLSELQSPADAVPSAASTATVTTVADGRPDVSPAVTVTMTTSVSWRNPADPNDVSGDDAVTPLDALIIVNHINAHPGDSSLPAASVSPPPFLDVTGDNLVTAQDAAVVINCLSDSVRPLAEGEPAEALLPAVMAGNLSGAASAPSADADAAATDDAAAVSTGLAADVTKRADLTAVRDVFDPPSQPRQGTSAEQARLWSYDTADSRAMVIGTAGGQRLNSVLADAVFSEAVTARATARTAASTVVLADDIEATINAVADGWSVKEV
jgi:hypothetical protein